MTHILNIDLRNYWHPGGGRGGGAVMDAVCHRDNAGLPVLPGRHLKGLLRDSLEFAEYLQWAGYAALAETLFGQRPETQNEGIPQAGSLRISDATLAEPTRHWLSHTEDGQQLTPHLFRSLYATAVEHATGTARNKSLRGVEVVVPVQLTARIEPVPGREPPPDDWAEQLRQVLPLIGAVGAQRHRGLGRAVLTLEEAS